VVKEESPRGEGTIGLYKAAVPNKPRKTTFTFTELYSVGGWRVNTLTLCRSYLKPYCMGRKAAFFFSGHLIYILKQERFRAFRPAGDI
jgi:CDGSH-type Zn-finger protein